MRCSTEDDRGAITRALLRISVWSISAWRQSSSTERAFQDKIYELWANHHRIERAFSRYCIADIIGGVRGIIPSSRLSAYGDYRYDVEKDDPFQAANYEIESETLFSRSTNIEDVSAENFSHVIPDINQSLSCDKGKDPTLSEEADFGDLCFHPAVNKIMEDFEVPQPKPKDDEFMFDWIGDLQNIFLHLRTLAVHCEKVKVRWLDHLLNTSSRFLKAAVLNSSLCSELKAGVPLTINYEQLFCESISLPELLSIPQPSLEQSDGLDSKEIRRLWAKVSSPGIRAQWKLPEEASLFGSLPSTTASALGWSDSVTLLTSYLLRKDEITDRKIQSDSVKEGPDTGEIDEIRARELLGSLLDAMGNDEKSTNEIGVEAEEEDNPEEDSSSLSEKSEYGQVNRPPELFSPQTHGVLNDEFFSPKSKSQRFGSVVPSSTSLTDDLPSSILLRSQEKNIDYITQNWIQSQLQAPQGNLRVPQCAEQTQLLPFGFLETTYTSVTTTKQHSLIGVKLPVVNVPNVYGHEIPHHARRHSVPPVIDFPSPDLGNFTSVPLSPAFHMPRIFQGNQQRNVLTAGQSEYDSWEVQSYALDKTAFPFPGNPIFKNPCHTRERPFKGPLDIARAMEPRKILGRGKLGSKPDSYVYLEQKKSEERHFRSRTMDHCDNIKPTKDIYVPPHARDGRYASPSNQNQPHIDFDTWLLHRSCSGRVLTPISLSNSQYNAKIGSLSGKHIRSFSESERYEPSHLQCSAIQTQKFDNSGLLHPGITESRIPFTTEDSFECYPQNLKLISSEKHPPQNNPGFHGPSCHHQIQSERRDSQIMPMDGLVANKHCDAAQKLQRSQENPSSETNLSSEVRTAKVDSTYGKTSGDMHQSEKLGKVDLIGRAGTVLRASSEYFSSLSEKYGGDCSKRLVDTGVQASFLTEWPSLLQSAEANVHFSGTDSREVRPVSNETSNNQQMPSRHRKRKKKSRGNFQRYQNGSNDVHAKDGRYTRKMLQQRKAKFSSNAPGHFPRGNQGGKVPHDSFCKHKHSNSSLVKGKLVTGKISTPTIREKEVTVGSATISRAPNVLSSSFHPFHCGSFRPSYSAVVEKGYAIYAECAENEKHKTEGEQKDRNSSTFNSACYDKSTGHKLVNPCDLPRVQDSELQPGVLPREIENAILKLIERSKLDRISRNYSTRLQPSLGRILQTELVSRSKSESGEELTAFDDSIGRASYATSPNEDDSKENDDQSYYPDEEEFLSISDLSSAEMFSCGANESTESEILDSIDCATPAQFCEEGQTSLSGDTSMTDFDDWSQSDSLFSQDPIEQLRISNISSMANSFTDLEEIENISFRSVSPDFEPGDMSIPSICQQRRNRSKLDPKHIITSTPILKANSNSKQWISDSQFFLEHSVSPEGMHSSQPLGCRHTAESAEQRVSQNTRKVELPFNITDILSNNLDSNIVTTRCDTAHNMEDDDNLTLDGLSQSHCEPRM